MGARGGTERKKDRSAVVTVERDRMNTQGLQPRDFSRGIAAEGRDFVILVITVSCKLFVLPVCVRQIIELQCRESNALSLCSLER